MTIEVGASKSGASMVFPVTSSASGRITLKTSNSTGLTSSASGFWTAIDTSHTEEMYETVSLSTALNTNEQTIVDLSGQAGVLTHVLCPVIDLSSSGTVTVRITEDGNVFTVTSPTIQIATQKRFSLVGM